MAFYPCNIVKSGKDFNIKEFDEVVLPDGYTNVDINLPDYDYKSYTLLVTNNNILLKSRQLLFEKGTTQSVLYYDPDDSTKNIGITVSYGTTYIRLRLGSANILTPTANVKFITTDIDQETIL